MLIAIPSGSAAISERWPSSSRHASTGQGTGFRFPTEQTSRKLFTMSEMRLYDAAGNRLYLNAEERAAFLAAARRHGGRDRTLCETLHYTGCRPSELHVERPEHPRLVHRPAPVGDRLVGVSGALGRPHRPPLDGAGRRPELHLGRPVEASAARDRPAPGRRPAAPRASGGRRAPPALPARARRSAAPPR